MSDKVEVLGFIDLDNKTTVENVTLFKNHSGRMHKFCVPWQITEKQALELQAELSYHPAGYGFYSFEATPVGTTWACGNSCD